ncbi:receptor-type tyrosine-protein phosphatase T-like [Haliotis rufescens]|uniref:receptor-type tyrosine-protein phosphatase T-like n=1 Tax=Haliotis rufescens TaxID=6454 RepID=UPI00201EC658|nr:receptor-type tyrosine-protein phosphatase T-like [Haliotis rufescens]XP_046382153.2 receptor-type tyrosine-protein phosphatase T-like [Haliotis rufescens]
MNANCTCEECNGTTLQCNDVCRCLSPPQTAGIVLLVLFVIGCVLLLGFILWRRKRKLAKPQTNAVEYEMSPLNNNKQKTSGARSRDCSAKDFSTANPIYVPSWQGRDLGQVRLCEELMSQRTMRHMMNEFQMLAPPDYGEAKCGASEDNRVKNRHKSVLPYDGNRILLKQEEKNDSDYINASFINGYRDNIRYVAAQGPSFKSVNDFWRLIWQENATKIVLLTQLAEDGKIKCARYWPVYGATFRAYDKVCVQCVEETVHPSYTVRNFAVWKGHSDTRQVLQFHFAAWADHDVPRDTSLLLHFHRIVKDTGPNSNGPLVVQSSAGAGRCGTFLAFDYLLDQARYEGRACVYSCVQTFRAQRMMMVETEEQYSFIHNILIGALQTQGTLPSYYDPVLVQCEKCWRLDHETQAMDGIDEEDSSSDYEPVAYGDFDDVKALAEQPSIVVTRV